MPIKDWRTPAEAYLQSESLPTNYMETVEHWFLPLIKMIETWSAAQNGPLVVGVSGSQGSGKSTLSGLLVSLLGPCCGLKAATLSMDDFYLGHGERQQLAASVHPLLATRGVPGTHEVSLALDTLRALSIRGDVALPRFNKAVDDRAPASHWPRVSAPLDVIVVEGWCLGLQPQPVEALQRPVNALEEEEDSDGRWRAYVNAQLAGDYQRWFQQIDLLVMLKAPGFEQVLHWRQRQEEHLARRLAQASLAQRQRLMNPSQLARFIQHYERLTRHALDTLPEKADVVFALGEDQDVVERLR